MVIVTGAAGFIGSCMVSYLHSQGYKHIIGVDDFQSQDKLQNFSSKEYLTKLGRDDLFEFLENRYKEVEYIIHLGARTDTVDQNPDVFNTLNLNYSKKIWNKCVAYDLKLIYASSAAT